MMGKPGTISLACLGISYSLLLKRRILSGLNADINRSTMKLGSDLLQSSAIREAEKTNQEKINLSRFSGFPANSHSSIVKLGNNEPYSK